MVFLVSSAPCSMIGAVVYQRFGEGRRCDKFLTRSPGWSLSVEYTIRRQWNAYDAKATQRKDHTWVHRHEMTPLKLRGFDRG